VTVESTAFVAAALRAAEAARNAPRVRDGFAALFQPDEGPAAAAVRRLAEAGGEEVVLRTAILDELLTQAVAARPAPLVLNLGAGFCARPYRLDLSGCALLVEFDAPEVLAYKEKVLASHRPSCPVRRVPLDVRDAPALRRALDELDAANRQSIVVSEGLLPYLPAERIAELAATLHTGLPDAVWLTDVVSVTSAQGMAQLAGSAGLTAGLYGLRTLQPLEDNGWRCVDYRVLPVARRALRSGSARDVVDGVAILMR
jgi:methyltransferase (TIGR00027 family)